jgi:RimJ/RimL family protein N-acetyltransferase
MQIDLGICVLRKFNHDDAPLIAQLANDRDIWINLRDRFPHPYELAHGEAFVARAAAEDPPTNLAVCVDNRAVGSIGLILGKDIERVSAEIGYWIGKPYWGRGITSAALHAATDYAIDQFGLLRVFAIPFVENLPSVRVLEKAGYVREGLMKQSAIKDGKVRDQYLYAYYAKASSRQPALHS